MATFNFTGDLELAGERQLEFISEALKKRGFKGPDARLENVGEAGDNYMSNVKRVIITENGETFKMFAKLASDLEVVRMMAQTEVLFRNEHTAYTKLFPKFTEIQKNAGVTELFRYAECYGSLDEAPNEIILLEDLKESGYSILDRFQPLSIESMKIVLKNLAIYHSLSFVLKSQEPETYDQIKSQLNDMNCSPMSKEGNIFFQHLEDTTLSMLSDKYKKYVKGSVSDLFSLQAKASRGDVGSKHSVIQQGDGWVNNMMFKSVDGVPAECILIDYQLVRESSPAYDIMFMIFNCTAHAQRQKHYYELLDYYHSELDLSLQNYGLKANFVYPRDRMDCDIKRYSKTMLAICIIASNAITKSDEDAVNMKEAFNKEGVTDNSMSTLLLMNQESAEMFKNRIEGLIDSFVEFGLL